MPPERYIGDGVYASFDGFQIWLRAERDGRIHRIAIEPEVWTRLNTYVEDVKAENKKLAAEAAAASAAYTDKG
jgi:hypothetical protein